VIALFLLAGFVVALVIAPAIAIALIIAGAKLGGPLGGLLILGGVVFGIASVAWIVARADDILK
jgi:hypothetical protein